MKIKREKECQNNKRFDIDPIFSPIDDYDINNFNESQEVFKNCPCSSIEISQNSMILTFPVWHKGIRIYNHTCTVTMDPYVRKFKIESHDFPDFLPVDLFESKLLNKRLKSFVCCISNCLNAYYSRKIQYDSIDVYNKSSNNAYDCIQFEFNIENEKSYIVKLLYEGLRAYLPTKVKVIQKESQLRIKEMEEIFEYNTLQDSLESIKSQCK